MTTRTLEQALAQIVAIANPANAEYTTEAARLAECHAIAVDTLTETTTAQARHRFIVGEVAS